MKIPSKPGKILIWVAWSTFLVSLLLPMERHTVPGPCAWPCIYPFTYTVGSNAFIFLLSPALLILYLFQMLFNVEVFSTVLIFTAYSAIGIGEILLLFAPALTNKIRSPLLRRLYLIMVSISALVILLYGFVPDLRFGIEALQIGYYVLVLSFLMMVLALLLRFRVVNE